MDLKYLLNERLPSKVFWKPLVAQVTISSHCNLRCNMCMRTIYGVKEMFMDLETWNKCCEIMRGRRINLSGMGEPLLHPEFDKFVDIALKNKIKLNTFTNGILVDKRIESLSKFNSICFSIDNITTSKSGHQSDFKKVFGNLEMLSGIVGKEKLWVNIIKMKSNENTIDELVKKMRPLVRGVGIVFSSPWDEKTSKENLCKNLYSKHCLTPFFVATILPNGDVAPCCVIGDPAILKENPVMHYNGKRTEIDVNKFVFGNINKDDFKDIWNSERFILFRKNLKSILRVVKNYKNEDYEKFFGKEFTCMICPYRIGLGY